LYFYGRENLIQEIINLISKNPCLALVGASGSGKSSLVRAGAIARLKQGKHLPGSEQWWIEIIRPGKNPIRSLALALVDKDRKNSSEEVEKIEGLLHLGNQGLVKWLREREELFNVLVVDQFEELEELFAPNLTPEGKEFLDLILESLIYAKDRFKLVITLRYDYLNACLAIPKLQEYLQKYSLLVPPKLSEASYREVIEKPAALAQLKVESGLVEILLKDLARSEVNLPLLQFVLEQLWEYKEKGQLTLRSYKEIGGLEGVLERHAQKVIERLNTEEREVARWLFLNLISLGDGTEDSRRQLPIAQLYNRGKYSYRLIAKTLEKFIAAKLIIVNAEGDNLGTSKGKILQEEIDRLKPEATIEVAHEILIRNWSTLRWWLQENHECLVRQERLEKQVNEWEKRDRHPDFLWSKQQLLEAENLSKNYREYLSDRALAFIRASQKARLKNRFKLGTAIALILITIISFSSWAWQERENSQLAQTIRYASFNVITPDIAKQISKSLPELLKIAQKNQRDKNIELALDDYRQILKIANNLQDKINSDLQLKDLNRQEIANKLQVAENNLAQIIARERLPQLERQLQNKDWGKSQENYQFTGAIATNKEILMDELGAKADLDRDNYLSEGEEKLLPCLTLKQIEEIWRKYTQNRCLLYDLNDKCQELGGQSIVLKIAFRPTIYLWE
jgi:energy-coupling factor transporter ATP-binding protein EcfA2